MRYLAQDFSVVIDWMGIENESFNSFIEKLCRAERAIEEVVATQSLKSVILSAV